MDLKVQGDPGQGNSFQDIDIESAGSYNPTAKEVNHYHYGSSAPSRMSSYFNKLCKEILHEVKAETIEELLNYQTQLDGTMGMEVKLTDGGFKPMGIAEARRQKEMYAKKATRYECYPSAQQINLNLFSRIKNEFYTSIYPLIEDQQDLRVVMKEIRTKIVLPIMDLLNANGAYDRHLNYTEDHIYGMIYYLTGMCHLNWKVYDNV